MGKVALFFNEVNPIGIDPSSFPLLLHCITLLYSTKAIPETTSLFIPLAGREVSMFGREVNFLT